MLELLSVEPMVNSTPQGIAAPPQVRAAAPQPTRASPPPARPESRAPEPRSQPEPALVAAPSSLTAQPASVPAAAASVSGNVAELRARWADVIAHATPVIKPLLSECRPIAREGAKLTLAFPEGRDFMRSRIAQRASAIEALLTDMFDGPFAIECVATNLELEPLTVEQAIAAGPGDLEAQALLEGVLKITGGELVDAPEVR